MNCDCTNYDGWSTLFGIVVVDDCTSVIAKGAKLTCECGKEYFRTSSNRLLMELTFENLPKGNELIFPVEESHDYTIGGWSVGGRNIEAPTSISTARVLNIEPVYDSITKSANEIARKALCPVCDQDVSPLTPLSPGIIHTHKGDLHGAFATLGFPTMCLVCGFSFFYVYMGQFVDEELKKIYPEQTLVPFFRVMDRHSFIMREGMRLVYSLFMGVDLKHPLFKSQKFQWDKKKGGKKRSSVSIL